MQPRNSSSNEHTGFNDPEGGPQGVSVRQPEPLDTPQTLPLPNEPVASFGADPEIGSELPLAYPEGGAVSSTDQSPYNKPLVAIAKRLAIIAIVILLLAIAGVFLLSRGSYGPASMVNGTPDQSISVQGEQPSDALPVLNFNPNTSKLIVNGDLITQGSLYFTSGDYFSQILLTTLTNNQEYLLPDASGTFCLDSNNCNFLTEADITATSLNGVTGQIAIGQGLAMTGATLSNTQIQTTLNNLIGALTLQGTPNQISISADGNVLAISTPQDIATTSTPSFAGVTLTATGTQNGNVLCDISNNCNFANVNDALIQGGNAFGATVVVGATDAFGVSVITGNVARVNISNTGVISLGGASTDRVSVVGQIAGSTPFVFQGGIDDGFTTSFAVVNPTANRTIFLPNSDGTICLDTGNCIGGGSGYGNVLQNGNSFGTAMTLGTNDNFVFNLETGGITRMTIDTDGNITTTDNFSVGGIIAGNGSGLTNLNGTNIATGTIDNARLVNNGALTVTAGIGLDGGGSVALGNGITLDLADTTVSAGTYGSASAVATFTVDAQGRITTASNTNIAIDTSQIVSGTIGVSQGGTGISAVGSAGSIAYSDGSTFAFTGVGANGECLISSGSGMPVWGSCSGGGPGTSLQDAYNNSTNPQIVLDDTRGTLSIRDDATPLGTNLFEVQNNDGSTTYFAVAATGATITGDLNVSGIITGDGSGLTDLNATNILTGTLANARLVNGGALTVSAGIGLTGGGSVALGNSTTLNLADTTVSAGSYGSASAVATFTVDAQGRLTAASSTPIAIDANQITSGTLTVAQGGTGVDSLGSAGSIAYSDGSTFAFSSVGTANQILTSGGSGAPTFQDIASLLTAGSNIAITGTTNATIATVSNPTFSTSVTTPILTSGGALAITPGGALTIGATNQTFTLQGNASSTITATGGGFTTTVGFTGTPTGAVIYQFDRSVTPGAYEICTTFGNCAGTGGGVTTPDGTPGRIAKFTSAQIIADSLLSEAGNLVTVHGNQQVLDGNLSIGESGATTGGLTLYNDSNGNTITLQAGATASNLTFTLPTADGSANQCLKTDGNGVFSFGDCLGGGSGVASLNGLTGALSIVGTSGQINVTPLGTDITLSLDDTGVTANSYGSASAVATFTVDAQGRLTAASSTPIAIDANQITSGTLTVAQGGTGATTFTPGGILYGNDSGAIQALPVLTDGQLLIGDGDGIPTAATLTAGTGIDITNGAGSISIGVDNTVCLNTNNCNYATSAQFATAILQGGNTFGTDVTIGSNDEFALNFETFGTTKMTILPNGNVGIGTTTPGQPLHIFAGVSTPLLLDRNNSNNVSIQFRNNTSSLYVGIDNSASNFAIGTTNNITSSALFRVARTTGNVDIVSGALQTAGTIRLTNAGELQNVTNADAGTFFTGGTLGVTRGGTGTSSVGSAGSVAYSNGSTYAFSTAGTSGQCLLSGGTGTPTWAACAPSPGSALITLQGTSGTPQQILTGDTVTIAAGTNIITTAGSTDTVTIATVDNPVFDVSVTTPIVDVTSRIEGNASDTASAPTYTWTGDLSTGIYHAGANQVGITAGGTSVATFATDQLTVSSGTRLRVQGVTIVEGSSDTRLFRNIASYTSSDNPATGAIVVKTNIPRNDRMNRVRLLGYLYDATQSPILDLTVAGYWSGSGYTWDNSGYVYEGRQPSNVQLGVDSSDNVVIIIGDITDEWYQPKLHITEWLLADSTVNDSDADNWQITIEDDLSGYSNLAAVPDTTKGSAANPFDTLSVTGTVSANAFLQDGNQVCDDSNNCNFGDILQGGNSFGVDMTIGTNDEFALHLETGGNTQVTIGTDGATTFQNSTDSDVAFQIQNAAGESLFTADTANTRIIIGDTESLDRFAKIENPTDLPISTGNGTAWSPDGRYMSVAHDTTPFITIYKRDGDTFNKLPDPSELPTATATATAWSPDSKYVSVSQTTSPYIIIYERDGDTFNKLPDPTDLPTGIGQDVAWSPDSKYMSVAHTTTPFITIYERNGNTFTKLPNPATLPNSTGNGTAWSPDGNYMSVAHNSGSFITIYKRDGDTFNRLPNPTDLPTNIGLDTAWSPDGRYMSVAHAVTPFITIYERNGDTFTKLTNPDDLPTGTGRGVAFSPDGQYMSVAHDTTPFITIYKREGNTFNKLLDPSELPTGSGNGTAWSPDGRYMSVAHVTSPYITIYRYGTAAIINGATRINSSLTVTGQGTFSGALDVGGPAYFHNGLAMSGDFRVQNAAGHNVLSASDLDLTIGYPSSLSIFTKTNNPTTLPAGNGSGVAFSPDGQYMTVAHTTTPFITIYKRTGDTFTKLPNPNDLPTGNGNGTAWSPDGQYMTVTHNTTPFITIYKRDGDTFTKLTNPSTLPPNSARGPAWSPDGQYMTVAHTTTPFVTIYRQTGDTFVKLPNPSNLPAGTGIDTTWSPDGRYMTVAHQTTPFITIYERNGNTFTKLTNPDDLPTGTGRGVAFSPDGQYMSVAHDTTPFITIYERDGNTFTKLPDPDDLPTGSGSSTAFSLDGRYMTVAHSTTPFITIYERNGNTFTKLTNPNVLPTSTGNEVAFSPDGRHMGVAHNNSPFVTIYKQGFGTVLYGAVQINNNLLTNTLQAYGDANFVSNVNIAGRLSAANATLVNASIARDLTVAGTTTLQGSVMGTGQTTFRNSTNSTNAFQVQNADADNLLHIDTTNSRLTIGSANSLDTFTNSGLTITGGSLAGQGNGTAWSPDGQYMSIAHNNSPGIAVYKLSGTTLTKLPDLPMSPTSSASDVAWSPDGQYMSVTTGGVINNRIIIYKRTGDTFTRLPNVATPPTGNGNGTAWSPDGQYMTVAHNTTPFITIYKRTGDTFTKLPDPADLPAGTGSDVAFSPDGQYMTVAHSTTPFITIYKRSGDTFSKLPDPSELPTGSGSGVAFSPDGQYMTVAHNTTPFITIYKRDGDTFNKLPDPSELPTGTGQDVAWSPDGQYMGIPQTFSPGNNIYKRDGDTFTKVSVPSVPGNGGGVGFSPDGRYVTFAVNQITFYRVYKYGTATSVHGAVQVSSGLSSGGGGYFGGSLDVVGSAYLHNALTVAGAVSVGGQLTTNGAVLLQNTVDSANAFQIQDASSATIFNVDTADGIITFNGSEAYFNADSIEFTAQAVDFHAFTDFWGGIGVADNSASGYAAYFVNAGNNANRYGIQIQAGANNGSGTTYYLNALDGDGDQVGYIANVAGTFSLVDVSDARTKTNIEDTEVGGLDIINQLKVVDFNRLASPNGPRITGFIAQDVQEVYSQAVSVGPDGMLGINKDAFIPVLVKGVQEQQDMITALQGSSLQHTNTISQLDERVGELEQQAGTPPILPQVASFTDLNVSGLTTVQSLQVNGSATVTGNLTVASATVNSTLTVAGAAIFNNTLTVNGHIITGNTGGLTTVTVGAGAGHEGSATISGNDTAGIITVNVGEEAVVADVLAAITFANPYGNTPQVVITPKDVPAGSIYPQFHYDSTTTNFNLKVFNALTPGKTYTFTYFVVQ